MAIIVDADVVIRAEKGKFDFERWLTSLPDEQFALAAITVAELWHGVERATGAHRTKRERFLSAVVDSMLVIPYTKQTAYEHAKIWARLKATGTVIGFYDLIVAATAIERGSRVATFNKAHFQRVQGLTIIDPA